MHPVVELLRVVKKMDMNKLLLRFVLVLITVGLAVSFAAGEGVCRSDQENCEEPDAGAGAQPAVPEIAGPLPPSNVTVKLTKDGVVRLVFI
jgi:hypothetical protein